MDFLKRIFRAGIDEGAPQDAKYTLLLNALSLLTAPIVIALGAAAYWSANIPIHVLVLVFGTGTVGYLLVPVLNAARRYDSARIVCALNATGISAGLPLLFGTAGLNHVYFGLTIIGAWYALPPHRRGMAWMLSLGNLGGFAAIHVMSQYTSPPYPALAERVFGMQTINLGTMLALMLVFGVYAHFTMAAASEHLEREQLRSEKLLRNILPASIAERLKEGPRIIAERFDTVTVLFADIVGFTSLSTSLPPERVVDLLNQVFTRFDELAARHRVEKIKTIGDAYMIVAGVPEPRSDHAEAAAEMALELRTAIGELSQTAGRVLQVRIGLCSGPAVAGVIGIQKFAYDLWGDTVNTAARMESHGVEGQIHVSESTYQAIRDLYVFEDRGTINVKGKGPMRTYFLQRRRDDLPVATTANA